MEYLDSLDPELKNDKDHKGNTALTLAARKADVATVKFLIETYNMKPQETGSSGGKIEIMKYLDSVDPDLKNDKDDKEETALTLAASFADLSTVKFLIETYDMKPKEKGSYG